MRPEASQILNRGQCFATNPPSFVWQAQVQFLPLLSFSVTDMFVDGQLRPDWDG